MKLYFSWIEETDLFDSHVHAQEQEEIFSFSLTEKEGEFPFVKIEMANPYGKLAINLKKQWCFISYEENEQAKLLFKGRICGVPSSINRETMTFIFIAQSSQWQEELQILHRTLTLSPLWDPLFVKEEARDEPTESLEGRSSFFYWDRTTTQVGLSDLFWGTKQRDLSNQHFYDSLNIRMGEPPLTAVNVTLSAQWIQQYKGVVDFSSLIKSFFREGIINTLTGKDLEKKWWKRNEKIGRSGYWIEKSILKEIKAPSTGILNLYPSHSDSLWVSPEDPAFGYHKPEHPLQKKIKRSWYHGILVLGWRFHQLRTEKVNFTLRHGTQLSSRVEHKTRNLNLHLQELCFADNFPEWHKGWYYQKKFRVCYQDIIYRCRQNHKTGASFEEDHRHWEKERPKPLLIFSSSQGRFFGTERGLKAIEHAIEMARAHLAASARVVEIVMEGPLDIFKELTCDHSVHIKDHRLPGGEAWGKIKDLQLFMEGEDGKQWGKITLGVAIGSKEKQEEYPVANESFYCLDYMSSDYESSLIQRCSYSGIQYSLHQNQENDSRWITPYSLTARDFIKEIFVKNQGVQQNEYLLKNQYPLRHDLESTLKEVPTRIDIKLHDLKSRINNTELIHVDIARPWLSPSQIDLRVT